MPAMVVCCSLFAPARILKLGTEPADDAAPFLLGAFGVQGHEAFEDLFVRQIVRPSVDA